MNTDELRDIANTLRALKARIQAFRSTLSDTDARIRLTEASISAGFSAKWVSDAAVFLEEHAVPGEGEV